MVKFVSDPFYDWLEKNPEAAICHAGKMCAFHPEHGLLAVGQTAENVLDVLGEKSKLEGLTLYTFPTNVRWIPGVVTELKNEWREWASHLLRSYSWIDTAKASDADLRAALERLVRSS